MLDHSCKLFLSFPCIVFLMMTLRTIPPCTPLSIHHNRNSNIAGIYMISKYFLYSVIVFGLFRPSASIRFFTTFPSLHPSSHIPTASSGDASRSSAISAGPSPAQDKTPPSLAASQPLFRVCTNSGTENGERSGSLNFPSGGDHLNFITNERITLAS